MTTISAAAAVERDSLDVVHPDAIRSRDCVSAECIECAEPFPGRDYAYPFGTRAAMLQSIGETDWQPASDGLRCPDCAGDIPGMSPTGEIEPECLDWLAESCCFTVQCTRCERVLESDCGEAHFPSTRAAADAALAARWLVSAHRVWCRACSALVSGSDPCCANTGLGVSHG